MDKSTYSGQSVELHHIHSEFLFRKNNVICRIYVLDSVTGAERDEASGYLTIDAERGTANSGYETAISGKSPEYLEIVD